MPTKPLVIVTARKPRPRAKLRQRLKQPPRDASLTVAVRISCLWAAGYRDRNVAEQRARPLCAFFLPVTGSDDNAFDRQAQI